MEQILLKTVVETFVPEIWKHHWPQKLTRSGGKIPSFREQEIFAKKLLFQSHVKDNMIFLYDGEGVTEKVPFYNYMLLINDKKDQVILTRTYWKIVGFQKSTELFDFMIQNDYLWPAIVFVKVEGRYKKVNCTYAYQRPGEEKEYANLWRFYHPDEKVDKTFERKQNYKYFVEINTLCEMEHENNVECYLINTYNDIKSYLQKKANNAIWDIEVEKTCTRFMEEGFFTWRNKKHRYFIKVENNSIKFYFLNESGLAYCDKTNRFSSSCEKSNFNCTKCCELLGKEKKTDVEVER